MAFDYAWISWTGVLILLGIVILFIIFPALFFGLIKILLAIVKGIAFVIGWIINSIIGLFGGKKKKGMKSSKNKSKRSFD